MDKVRYGVIGIGNMGNGYINDYNSGNIKGGVLLQFVMSTKRS